MSTNDKLFKAELFALMRKYNAIITWDATYYDGETEDIRFELAGSHQYLEMKDLQHEFELTSK